ASPCARASATGMSRLDDGRAAVTALALAPLDGSVVIGYADGSTAVWPLDQPAFDPPRAGPKGDGAVRRIQFDSTGQIAYLSCDNGLVAAPLLMPPAVPLKARGGGWWVLAAPGRARCAAARGGRLCAPLAPTGGGKKPPRVRGPDRFSLCPPRLEAIPGGLRPDYPVMDSNPT